MASYSTLTSALNWATGLPTKRTTTLATGTLSAPPSILIPHTLASALTDSRPTILVSFVHTYNHYSHIMRKMGFNLPRAANFRFVNALSPLDLETLPESTRPHFAFVNPTADPQQFVQWLKQHALPGAVVVIDGLCTLVDCGASVEWTMRFVRCCKRIVEDADGRLVLCVLADGGMDSLVRALVTVVHYVLAFEGLVSGSSNEVSGQLTAVPGHLYTTVDHGKAQLRPTLLHYRVTDATVSFFSPGQARIVL